MIVGIGVDLVDIDRFARALARTQGLGPRLLTDAERALPMASQAARFAAKEAVAKALGAPGGMRWHDCEVWRTASGAPELVVTGTVAAAAVRAGVTGWRLSLSHDGGMATAFVVALGAGPVGEPGSGWVGPQA